MTEMKTRLISIEKQELESLRRQKREWEYERATMLAEMDFQRKRVNLLRKEYEAMGEQFSRVLAFVATVSEMVSTLRSALGAAKAKLEDTNCSPINDEVFDGPDDVDVEQMQSTADYDMEAMPGGND